MKKTIAIIVATSFLGLGTAPAFAMFPFFVPVMMAKEDKNFKAVNPYDKKVSKVSKQSKKKM